MPGKLTFMQSSCFRSYMRKAQTKSARKKNNAARQIKRRLRRGRNPPGLHCYHEPFGGSVPPHEPLEERRAPVLREGLRPRGTGTPRSWFMVAARVPRNFETFSEPDWWGERTREPGWRPGSGSRVRSPHLPVHGPDSCPEIEVEASLSTTTFLYHPAFPGAVEPANDTDGEEDADTSALA